MNEVRQIGAGADQTDPNQTAQTDAPGNGSGGGSGTPASTGTSTTTNTTTTTTTTSGMPGWLKVLLLLAAVGGLGYAGYVLYNRHKEGNTYLLATESPKKRKKKRGKKRK